MPQETQVLEGESLNFAGINIAPRKLFDRWSDALLKDEIYRVDNARFGARHIDNDNSYFLKPVLGWKSIKEAFF